MMARARIVVSLELRCLQSLAALIYREGKILWPGKKFMWGAVASRNRGENLRSISTEMVVADGATCSAAAT